MDKNKRILFEPKIEPYRHYESDANFFHDLTINPIVGDPLSIPLGEDTEKEVDLLLGELQEIYQLIDFMPIPIRPIIENILVTITTETIIKEIPPPPHETPPEMHIPEEPIPEKKPPKPTPHFPSEPEKKKIVTPKPIPKNDPFGFDEGPKKDVQIGKSLPISEVVNKIDYRNNVRIKRGWIAQLSSALSRYMHKMMHAVRLTGAEDITAFLLLFDGWFVKTDKNKKEKAAHDTIVRNDAEIREKSKLLAKVISPEELLKSMRALEVTSQTRSKYYSYKYSTEGKTFLEQMENDLLFHKRRKYDLKYIDAANNYYKLLTSSVKLTDDIFNLTAESAMAKAVLLNKGIDIFAQRPIPDPIYYLNTLNPSLGDVDANGRSKTGTYAKQANPNDPTWNHTGYNLEGVEITAIGDSLLAGSQEILRSKLSKFESDAKVGRQASEAIEIFKNLAGSTRLGKLVIVSLGTNGDMVSDGSADKIMEIIGTERDVLWYNNYATASNVTWAETNNNHLNELRSKYPKLRILDWKGTASSKNLLSGDGVHPSSYEEFAQLALSALGK